MTLDGGKLVHVQKWDGQETTLVRELVDGKLILVRWITLEPPPVGHHYCPFSQACWEGQGLPHGINGGRGRAGVGLGGNILCGSFVASHRPSFISQLTGYMTSDKSPSPAPIVKWALTPPTLRAAGMPETLTLMENVEHPRGEAEGSGAPQP